MAQKVKLQAIFPCLEFLSGLAFQPFVHGAGPVDHINTLSSGNQLQAHLQGWFELRDDRVGNDAAVCRRRLETWRQYEGYDRDIGIEALIHVQQKLEAGEEQATNIWRSMGYYMGYAIAHYADFYDLKHVLVLGRCTSGRGGDLIVEGAKEVLESEFPEVAAKVNVMLPDEKARRVGQSIAAASLPAIS